ncbi:hypothetical protein EYF80_043319 [Liparis tanakae]|uniref:Uncharacterized protein n=1 Tax=Liparis tanakae TaxID=230148 RepID=A0A4Z2FZN9_9TELE|nr:hypothetical protein EYF80_043319 [Liparis tanakae]
MAMLRRAPDMARTTRSLPWASSSVIMGRPFSWRSRARMYRPYCKDKTTITSGFTGFIHMTNEQVHPHASGAQVLDGSGRGLQHGGVLGLLQQGGVDADHLRLVQQLIAYRGGTQHVELERQPAVLVRDVSHSRCLGLQFSSPPPPAPLEPRSQPEWGTITSSERACSAWSTISIFTESWDERIKRKKRKEEEEKEEKKDEEKKKKNKENGGENEKEEKKRKRRKKKKKNEKEYEEEEKKMRRRKRRRMRRRLKRKKRKEEEKKKKNTENGGENEKKRKRKRKKKKKTVAIGPNSKSDRVSGIVQGAGPNVEAGRIRPAGRSLGTTAVDSSTFGASPN